MAYPLLLWRAGNLDHHQDTPPWLSSTAFDHNSERARKTENHEAGEEKTRGCIFDQLVGQYTLPVFARSRGEGA